ncbi:MAG: class I SAM-dependent methyltransferase [Acidobacteria bacterium]|nr:class I SAM-dependent methyltransferase [Acidobacteriota bacterium]
MINLRHYDCGGYTSPDDPGEPGHCGAPRWSVTDDEAALLTLLARGKRVLEVGTGLGVSTRALARSAASVVTIDIDPWVQEQVWPDLPAAVRREQAPPVEGQFDLVFIDGEHSAASVAADLVATLPLLRPGGLIVLHDMHGDGVRSAATAAGVAVFVIPTHNHIGLAQP